MFSLFHASTIRNIAILAAFISPVLLTTSQVGAENYSAGNAWGTQAGGISIAGAAASAAMHAQNGIIAGQVNAAERGLLVGTGSSGSIQTIGSQSIVSSTIYGDDNTVDQVADQTTENTGDVTNDGKVVLN